MSEVKSNEEMINDIFLDMANQKPEGGTQGVTEDGTNLNNEQNTNTEEVTNQEQTTEEVQSTELESSEASNSNTETPPSNEEGTVEDTTTSTEEEFDLFSDWDTTDASTTETTSEETVQDVDFSSIAKELEIEAKSKEDLINAYKKLKEDAQKADKYSELPLDITEAIELAKNGQDYTTVFNKSDAIDHKIYDDRTLLLNQNSKYFTDPEGNVNMEGLSEYVDDMTEVQQKIEASKVREQIDGYNLRKKEDTLRSEKARRDSAQMELQKAVSETNDIKGFKVTAQHKEEAMKNISAGEAMKELFFKDDGKTYDMKKVFENYFIIKNFDKMKSFLSRVSKDKTRTEDFNNISNAQVNVTEHKTNVSANKQPDSLTDVYLDHLKSQIASVRE